MNRKCKALAAAMCGLLLAGSAEAQNVVLLERDFVSPPKETAPWVFWYWMHGAATLEGVKADLEAMKEIGLGGAYLMPIKSPPAVPFITPTAEQLSPQWWKLVKYAMEKADTLGLELGMHICDGFALAGGPWITPELSMQKVVWADTVVDGGRALNLRLPQPPMYEDYYEDIAVYALPVKDPAAEYSTRNRKPAVTASVPNSRPELLVEPGNTVPFRSAVPCWIQYDFREPFTCRSILIETPGNNYQAHRLVVSASDDGSSFREVARLTPARHGWQNLDAPNTHVIPPTTARYFRLSWDPAGTEPGSEDLDAAKWKPSLGIRELHLSGEPKIGQYEGKSAAVWRIAPETTAGELPAGNCVNPAEVRDLTASLQDGRLRAGALPEGRWRILRLGHTSTGHVNATGGAGKGLECDKFNPKAVEKQFDGWFAEIFRQVGPELAGRVLKIMHVDSWECGSQNWSENFAAEFRRRRGYDLMPWLPLYAGIPMGSAEQSEKVLRDIRETAAELVADVFYRTLAKLGHEYGCRFTAECVSPTMTSDGMLHYRETDIPMGEFWLRSPTHDKPNDMLDAIHGAHIYGKNIVQAEGFTQLRTMWDEHPGMIKTMLDRNYALGINKIVYHVYVHNPWLDRKPGMTLDGIGLYMQRDQTWWNQGRAWVDYAKRCQALLQRGVPVTDVAVFTGEDVPRRAVLPDRLVNSLPGIFGPERVESERVRLANVGQPQRTMPVGVKHSAGMADPEKWVDPLNGYAYDSSNKDVLLRARAANGRMVLPSGASYAVVVFPLPDRMTPNRYRSDAVAAKIRELKAGGVTVLTEGEGLPYTEDSFVRFGVDRDFTAVEESAAADDLPAGDIAWVHRRDGNAEIYFVSNQREKSRSLRLSLRCGGKVPQLWNPVTGERREAFGWTTDGRRTYLPLELAPNESVFVVLGRPAGGVMSGEAPAVLRDSVPLQLDWAVEFPGTGKTERWPELRDWSRNADEQIRYFSGTAVYRTEFRLQGTVDLAKKYHLDLGRVGVMAEVFLNGESCGIAWTYPYRVDVSRVLKAGRNELRIEAVNTWANRMIGVKEGRVSGEGVWTNAPYRLDRVPLCESGVLGPLTLVIENRTDEK